ncbi:hypothetical protein BYT27DRAFT_7200887 [Phlegmacium glaucopus]|nr:hypothetical protein BYT27DRAFT_7200887 [Phlegmacium glaucopus]
MHSTITTATTAVVAASFEATSSTVADSSSCVNHSSPQCCHCGWRGSHSPNCPFR